ncbi:MULTISPECIES: glycosyltransferase family 2 protein [Methylosinus]|nr:MULTISPECIES: glycosyltransferase family 2 protein [Methylosinus]
MTAAYRLPIVSIIVTNYNYGRFLPQALNAVRQQTYPHLECIVVDDCSTDCSHEALDTAVREWPELIVIRQQTNGGQSASCLAGLARASGQYIVFLDADDLITEEFVAAHLAAHFCLRTPVGMTCCDCFTLRDERLICSTSRYLAGHFASRPADPTLVHRGGFDLLREAGFEPPEIDFEALRLIPWNENRWPWSSMSAMMFRRDALDLVTGAKGFVQLRVGTDCFLAWAVNRLTGSVIMELPMMIYRIHGSNSFAARASLNHMRPGHAGLVFDYRADQILLDHLIENFRYFHAILDNAEHLRGLCELVDQSAANGEKDRPTLSDLLSGHFDEIVGALGHAEAALWLKKSKGAHGAFGFLGVLPPRVELEIAKFLCSIGSTRGDEVWNRAIRRLS